MNAESVKVTPSAPGFATKRDERHSTCTGAQCRLLLRSQPEQARVSGLTITDTTDDDARPDREESELLFGEAISWLSPKPPGSETSPTFNETATDVDLEPSDTATADEAAAPDDDGSAAEPAAAPAGDPAAVDDVSPGMETAVDQPARKQKRSSPARRNRIVAAAAVAAVIAVVAVVLLAGGNDHADVSTARRGSGTSTAAASTTAATPSTSAPAPTTANAGTTVTVNADVLFDVGSAELTPAASDRLGGVLALARTDARRHLLIEGYTDSDGDPTFNQQLSQARAEAVAQWLIGQGIDATRISVLGHGESNPIAPNDTPENKALNRRVVVTLQPA